MARSCAGAHAHGADRKRRGERVAKNVQKMIKGFLYNVVALESLHLGLGEAAGVEAHDSEHLNLKGQVGVRRDGSGTVGAICARTRA